MLLGLTTQHRCSYISYGRLLLFVIELNSWNPSLLFPTLRFFVVLVSLGQRTSSLVLEYIMGSICELVHSRPGDWGGVLWWYSQQLMHKIMFGLRDELKIIESFH